MKLDAWVKSRIGRRTDVDGAYGAQCWDLAADAAKQLYGAPTVNTNGTGAARGAYDANPNANDKYFKRVPVGAIPEPGWIVVWGKGMGFWGHIAVVLQADSKGFVSLDQNVPYSDNGRAASRNRWSYNHVIGYLVPKNSKKAAKSKPAKKPAPPPVVIAKVPKLGEAKGKTHVTVGKGQGVSYLAKAAGYPDFTKSSRWAAIAKLNGYSDWKKFNASLEAGQKVKVRTPKVTKKVKEEVKKAAKETVKKREKQQEKRNAPVKETSAKKVEVSEVVSGAKIDEVQIMGDNLDEIMGSYEHSLGAMFGSVSAYLGKEETKKDAGNLGKALADNIDKLGVPTHIAFFFGAIIAVYSSEIGILESVSTFALGSRSIQDATKGATTQRTSKSWWRSRKLWYMLIGVVIANFVFHNVESVQSILQTYFGAAAVSGGATVLGKKLAND